MSEIREYLKQKIDDAAQTANRDISRFSESNPHYAPERQRQFFRETAYLAALLAKLDDL